ncbi:hypothetical protein SAMN05421647_1036 [Marinobacterium stanieri]|uniref:Uncharacterized protein n=1 Tax=Marinobacterium stanieri TaxID=49186 RepID=A0A1N6QYR1_9GAMM|nr:hypothetical protein SAMN05421647_1036 [Marinobacterium stanieri]
MAYMERKNASDLQCLTPNAIYVVIVIIRVLSLLTSG